MKEFKVTSYKTNPANETNYYSTKALSNKAPLIVPLCHDLSGKPASGNEVKVREQVYSNMCPV